MVVDVRSAVAKRANVSSFGRGAGFVVSPDEVIDAVKKLLVKGGDGYGEDIR